MATRTPAPAHLPVEDGTNVECPWHGPRTLDGCRDCAFLQGTLDGPDVSTPGYTVVVEPVEGRLLSVVRR